MKRILNLLKKDIILGIKDIFILLEIGFAIILVFVLLFIIPEDIKTEARIYIYDQSDIVKNFVLENNPDIDKEAGEYFVDSREDVIKGMNKNKLAVGIIIKENENDKYNVEMLTQPYTKPALAKYIEVDLEDLLSILSDVYPPEVHNRLRIDSLDYGKNDSIPFNKRILPVVLLFMVGILGLFAMVSLTTQEKSEATIKVYRITPADMWSFLISKMLMIILTGITTFSILYIPIMGMNGYFESLLIMILTIIMGSAIGIIFAGFFDNIMTSILWVMLLMIILTLPAVSLFSPLFTPNWLKIIPTYHTLFALDSAMFPDNNSHIIWQSAIILAIIDVVLFTISGLIFNNTVRREV
jgi:hypothetical protein